jgi:hypothetical protein
MLEVLGSIPTIAKKKKKKRRGEVGRDESDSTFLGEDHGRGHL